MRSIFEPRVCRSRTLNSILENLPVPLQENKQAAKLNAHERTCRNNPYTILVHLLSLHKQWLLHQSAFTAQRFAGHGCILFASSRKILIQRTLFVGKGGIEPPERYLSFVIRYYVIPVLLLNAYLDETLCTIFITPFTKKGDFTSLSTSPISYK